MSHKTRAVIYARVSTSKQSCDNQLRELERVADSAGFTIVARFTDDGISGAKGRDQRPALDRLMSAAVRREFDIVMVWSIDRLGRSLAHLVEVMNELHKLNIDLLFHQQAIDKKWPHRFGQFLGFAKWCSAG